MLPIIMQQVQPAAIQAAMQSQQPWIILQHSASPEVQVTQHPSLVVSHLHIPIVMLQQQTIIPFIMQQQLTIPPAIILHKFCIMAQAAGSEQVHVIFIPPAQRSTFIVQRGTITMFAGIDMAGMGMLIPPAGIVEEFADIGFIIAVTMCVFLCSGCLFDVRSAFARPHGVLVVGDNKPELRRFNCDRTGLYSNTLFSFRRTKSRPLGSSFRAKA